MYTDDFQKLHDTWYNRWSEEADKKIQLSSTKSDVKEIVKNIKECHYFHYIFYFRK